jgi:hypothetical protein
MNIYTSKCWYFGRTNFVFVPIIRLFVEKSMSKFDFKVSKFGFEQSKFGFNSIKFGFKVSNFIKGD